MESLYRKYRPQTFDDVVGQRHVVETLEHAVLEGRTSHAYLFCGPRGTGKTTMARLLAKALLCERGPGQLPDGTCEECRLIAEGDHPDVYELDAASRTGVDNVREEIINRVNYAPTRGRYKVYIIDEVHMLTTAAFNALLKTLEEPPEHIVFVLCTTDPQKIPATILSRVQRFDFHAISNDDIRKRLVYVCNQEGFTYDDEAIELVVRHARGGMRDALSTLEQLSVFGDGAITADAARDLLGETPSSSLSAVVGALASRDVATLFGEVGKLVDAGRDLLQFVRELAARVRDLYVIAAVGMGPGVVQATGDDLRELEDEAKAFGSADRLARILCILGDVSNEMRTATNQRLVLEIAFTRMARPEGDLTLEALAERIERLEQGGLAASPPSAAPVRPVAPPAQEPAPVPAPAPEPRPKPSPKPRHEPRPKPAPQPEPAPQPAASAATAGAITDGGQLQRMWKQVVDTLVRTAASRGSLLVSSNIVSDDGSTLLVTLPKGSGFALKMLERQDVRSTVDPVVRQIFGARHVKFAEAAQGEAAGTTAKRSPRKAEPAPKPQPEPRPAPAQPAPAPVQPQQPAPAAYAAPWETPAQAAPPYEEVPYDDAGAASFDETDEAPAPQPAATLEPERQQPTPEPEQEPKPVPEPKTKPEPKPPAKAETAAAAESQPAHPEAGSARFANIPDDIPPDLTAVIESAFDVFGSGVKVSKVPKRPASGTDA